MESGFDRDLASLGKWLYGNRWIDKPGLPDGSLPDGRRIRMRQLPNLVPGPTAKVPWLQPDGRPVQERMSMVKESATQRQEVKALVMLKVAAAKVMLRRGVSPSLINTVLSGVFLR